MREADWKLFRKRVPQWRERYLEKKNRQLLGVLTQKGKTPTELFWETKDRIDQEAQILIDCFDGHSRSKLRWILLLMHRHGVIDSADLTEFSEALRQEMNRALGEDDAR